MGKVIKFTCSDRSDDSIELEAYVNNHNEIFISLEDERHGLGICIDRTTALELIDHLKDEVELLTYDL
jgi:hypothetical protein